MQNWFIFALLSVFVIAGSEISQKVSLTQKVNISAITNNFFVWTLQGFGGIILVILLGQNIPTLTPTSLLKLILVAVVYFLGGTFFYTSYKANSPSISIILGSISIVVSTILGIMIFGESRSIEKLIGIALILFSIIFVNYRQGTNISKYNLFAIIGGLCYGVAYNIDKSFAIVIPPASYVTLMCFSVAAVSIIAKSKHILSDTKRMRPKDFRPILASSFFGTLFNFFTFMSYKNSGNVGVVDAMNNSSIFIIILFEILLLKDRTNLMKKLISAGIVTIGIGLLSTVN